MKQRNSFSSDSLVLVPGSELPFIDEWKQIAQKEHSIVVVLPAQASVHEGLHQVMARTLALEGRPVKLLRARRER